MAAIDIRNLVSQSEKKGITLAEMIARSLSPEQMVELQSEISRNVASMHAEIKDFMSDVHVPSIEDILASNDYSDTALSTDGDPQLSDECESESDSV